MRRALLLFCLAVLMCAPAVAQQAKRAAQDKAARPDLAQVYARWLSEDIVYLITPQEKSAFQMLKSDAEREQFVEAFWRRRDPDPDTPAERVPRQALRARRPRQPALRHGQRRRVEDRPRARLHHVREAPRRVEDRGRRTLGLQIPSGRRVQVRARPRDGRPPPATAELTKVKNRARRPG